jgi:chaperonin GroES
MAKKAAATATLSKSNIKVVPLGDRVVLRREDAQTKTSGGIVLPDTARDKPQKGEVIAVGDGHLSRDGKRYPLMVKPGDRVIFSSYAGDEIQLEEQNLLLMRESDILAIY